MVQTAPGVPHSHDNFFDLGGHSLTATQLISRLHERLGVYLTIHEMFRAPTVAGIAKTVADERESYQSCISLVVRA